MKLTANYAIVNQSGINVQIELMDDSPSWKPNRDTLILDPKIQILENGVLCLVGRKREVEQGFGLYDDPFEIDNPELYRKEDTEKQTVTKRIWFKKTTREAYFATKRWITKKSEPKVELTSSVFTILDYRLPGKIKTIIR
jgi:hypothetical protein